MLPWERYAVVKVEVEENKLTGLVREIRSARRRDNNPQTPDHPNTNNYKPTPCHIKTYKTSKKLPVEKRYRCMSTLGRRGQHAKVHLGWCGINASRRDMQLHRNHQAVAVGVNMHKSLEKEQKKS